MGLNSDKHLITFHSQNGTTTQYEI